VVAKLQSLRRGADERAQECPADAGRDGGAGHRAAPRALCGQQIAKETGVSPATVSRILRAAKLSRARDLDPPEPVVRYERQTPGEMIHLDIKKLGRSEKPGHCVTGDRTGQSNNRGVGWEFVHVCIDDHSRLAFSQILPDETAQSAVPFLRAAVAYYASLGVTVVMTDNGSCYISHAFRDACVQLGLKHIRTKPYTPKTTARPSASSRPRSGNGPTHRPIRPPPAAPLSCRSGYTATTGIDPMVE
jgi:hypothetical protein